MTDASHHPGASFFQSVARCTAFQFASATTLRRSLSSENVRERIIEHRTTTYRNFCSHHSSSSPRMIHTPSLDSYLCNWHVNGCRPLTITCWRSKLQCHGAVNFYFRIFSSARIVHSGLPRSIARDRYHTIPSGGRAGVFARALSSTLVTEIGDVLCMDNNNFIIAS